MNATTVTNMASRVQGTSIIRDYVVQSPDYAFRGIRVGVPPMWLADTVATALFVSAGGIHLEANPLVRWVFLYSGVGGFIFLKLLVLALWLTLANRIRWQVHAALSGILFTVVCMGIALLTQL